MRRLASILILAAAIVLGGSPRAPVLGSPRATSIAAVRLADLREWEVTVDSMSRSGSLELRTTQSDPLIQRRHHRHYAQFYRGVPVFGGGVVEQMDGSIPVSMFGQLYQDIAIETAPAISAGDAEATIEQSLPASKIQPSATNLVIVPTETGAYRLAYRVVSESLDRTVAFVDARDGSVILSYSNIQRQAAVGRGTGIFGDAKKVSATASVGMFLAEDALRPPAMSTFDLRGDAGHTLNFLNGFVSLGVSDVATSANNTWVDGPTVDAHVYAGFTYDYYFKRFGRRGLDNHDIPMTVVVHPVRRTDLAQSSNDVIGLLFLNAFYAGDGVVVYGEGLPPGFVLSGTNQTVDYFAAGLDIVAHELSHGVTEFTSGLIYLNESGALNEAFSDFMGLSVKFFIQPRGLGLMQANYELGSDVFRPGGLRSFDNPAAFGDPDHYSKRVLGPEDNGGVHTNCTIVDHAFYLAIEGGTNRTSGLSVQGVGAANREQIEKVFYRGFTLMLTPTATFSMARAATIQSARDLYGIGSAAERAVTQAWAAVGVS